VKIFLIPALLAMVFSCSAPAPPTAPPLVRSKAGLVWNPSIAPNVTYRVYRGTQAGGPYVQVANNLSQTSYDDTGVKHGRTYYYVARSFNGLESGNSNELKVTIP